MVRRVLSKVNGITVRDPESALLLRDVGVEGPPVEITADPVFALESPMISISAANEGALLPSGLEGPLIAMAMRAWPARPGWKKEVAGAARRCAEQLSATLVWVAMHPPGDVELAHELAGLAGGERNVVVTGRSPREWLGLFRHFDLVVGMRLHSLILAAACGTPFVGLSYDPKVESLLRLFGRETSLRLGESDEESLYAEIMRGWETREAQTAQNARIAGDMRLVAAKTAEKALSVARKTVGRRGQN
jgi:polysaccharide pyruvyl transferase WcaK-like protein